MHTFRRHRLLPTAGWFLVWMALLGTAPASGSSHGGSDAAEPALPEAKPDEIRGVELGNFRIRSDYPAEAQKSTVRFRLYAAVRGDKLASMYHLIDSHRQKIRDEVITSTRLSPLGVFEEPDLKSLRRRIFMRLKRSMPELVLEDLYVSDFAMTVKSL